MRALVLIGGAIAMGIWSGCKRGEMLVVPAEVGQGLSKPDSLGALLSWLRRQSGDAADSLRPYVIFELIRAVGPQNSDSAYKLAQELEALARKSAYPASEELSYLGWSLAYFYRSMYDSVLYQAYQALAKLNERGHEWLRAKALYLVGMGHDYKGSYDSALFYYKWTANINETKGDKPELAQSYKMIGGIYTRQGRYSNALEHYQKAYEIYKAVGDSEGVAQSYLRMGATYAQQSRYEEALECYRQACHIWEANGNERGLAMSYNNIGNILGEQGRYTETLEYYQKALQIWETTGDQAGIASSYNNIGRILDQQGRYAEALEYYQKALQIWEDLGDKEYLATSYTNIGTIYAEQGRYAEALEYHQKERQIWEDLGDKEGLARFYNNTGEIYLAQGRYREALKHYRISLEILETFGNRFALTYSYANMGHLYYLQRQPHLARPYLLKAVSIAKDLGANDRLREIYRHLSQTDSLLAASGQPAYWKTAYEYARLHHAYSDSVSNKETIRKQAQLESQYEYDKKTALLKAQQEKERALATAELKRRETQRNLSLAALFIALTGMSVFALLYRTIRRQKKLLQAQAEEIQEKNASLEQYNAELQSTNEALEASYRVIQEQSDSLLEKNREILDSIRYAERIQRAILPSEEKWKRLLPESFLLYLPRDIVAGDFYWVEETERYVFLGIADATGHGVPGAFVSLVCANALNKAVIEEGLESPAEILNRAREVVSALLTQDGGKLRDGMDIALVRFEREARWRLTYAGANRPLWVVTGDGELIELRPTRRSVGYTEEESPFEEVELDLRSRLPVMVYGFTDGIVDQMGGPKGRKLMTKGLRELLLGMADLPCAVQREQIEAFFTQWKGEIRQMDDVTLVGVRVG